LSTTGIPFLVRSSAFSIWCNLACKEPSGITFTEPPLWKVGTHSFVSILPPSFKVFGILVTSWISSLTLNYLGLSTFNLSLLIVFLIFAISRIVGSFNPL